VFRSHKAAETEQQRHRHAEWMLFKGIYQCHPFRSLFQTTEYIFLQATVYKHMNKYPKKDSPGCGCERVRTHRIDHFNISLSKNVTFAYAKILQ